MFAAFHKFPHWVVEDQLDFHWVYIWHWCPWWWTTRLTFVDMRGIVEVTSIVDFIHSFFATFHVSFGCLADYLIHTSLSFSDFATPICLSLAFAIVFALCLSVALCTQ